MQTTLSIDLQKAVNDTVNSPFFAGNPKLLDHVEWRPLKGTGQNEKLYIKSDDIDEYCEAQLECIAQISMVNFRLLPCGGYTDAWDRATLITTKASAFLVPPRDPILLPGWQPVPNAIQTLQNNRCLPNSKIEHGIVQFVRTANKDGLKIRHTLYRPVTDPTVHAAEDDAKDPLPVASSSAGKRAAHARQSDSESEESISTEEFPPITNFTLETWPCKSQAAQIEFRELLRARQVVPVPIHAIDEHGITIAPNQWEQKLPGADVRIKFTATHQILDIRVLRPAPKITTSSPTRKRQQPTATEKDTEGQSSSEGVRSKRQKNTA
ncbi:hypothetical protein NM688_g414 [Phlebia brevispora]|uniref:Uncharacterized protein n=1 Tax=Phlebia brevispora TaxID=194682 RepID=A0ACC1TEN8_9APHY|nr:hypothetical protein NM688_g414 [Phlebia brevispora]